MRYKGTSEKTDKRTKSQNHKATNGQTQKIKVNTEGPIVFVFMLCFLSFFGGPIGPSVFILFFEFVALSVFPDFQIFLYISRITR